MNKPKTSSRASDDLSIGFDGDRGKRQQESIDNKNTKGNFYLGIMLEDVFGFAEHQEKTTCGLGHKLALARNKDEAVLDKVAGTADATIKNDHIQWYITQYTAYIQQQSI